LGGLPTSKKTSIRNTCWLAIIAHGFNPGRDR
jgi:hypothetical protein